MVTPSPVVTFSATCEVMMRYGPYADANAAFDGAVVELDYVRRGYPTWRAEQEAAAGTDDLINSFAAQFGVVLEQHDQAWFWTVPDEAETLA